MKGIITIIGGIVSGIVIWLTWYLSPEKIKMRAFKNDEKAKNEFKTKLVAARYFKSVGRKGKARRSLNSARSVWLLRMRENKIH